MPKLRKMLGNVESQECLSMMRLIETQSVKTLTAWAVDYARETYLPIYEAACPGDLRLRDAITVYKDAAEETKNSGGKPDTVRQALEVLLQIARDTTQNPVAQAAARAVSTACATLRTPTNALGFLFYGAAAAAYHEAGLTESEQRYDELAAAEWKRAIASLEEVSVPNEPNPARIKWGC